MKIKIEATEQGLKVASCFVDVELENGHVFNCVIGKDFIFNGAVGAETIGDEVTIDLSTQQPCIYMCMKHGLKVELTITRKGHESGGVVFDFSKDYQSGDCLSWLVGKELKSIKILDLEDMEGIEVIND